MNLVDGIYVRKCGGKWNLFVLVTVMLRFKMTIFLGVVLVTVIF